jgi:hypothetical protein
MYALREICSIVDSKLRFVSIFQYFGSTFPYWPIKTVNLIIYFLKSYSLVVYSRLDPTSLLALLALS